MRISVTTTAIPVVRMAETMWNSVKSGYNNMRATCRAQVMDADRRACRHTYERLQREITHSDANSFNHRILTDLKNCERYASIEGLEKAHDFFYSTVESEYVGGHGMWVLDTDGLRREVFPAAQAVVDAGLAATRD